MFMDSCIQFLSSPLRSMVVSSNGSSSSSLVVVVVVGEGEELRRFLRGGYAIDNDVDVFLLLLLLRSDPKGVLFRLPTVMVKAVVNRWFLLFPLVLIRNIIKRTVLVGMVVDGNGVRHCCCCFWDDGCWW